MMTRQEYEQALTAALDTERGAILEKLTKVMAHLPEKATGFDIGIHPDQDQEGFVAVMVHPTGPDSYVLNKAVAEYRRLFEIKIESDRKMSFGLPMFDPHGADIPVGDIQVDTIAAWFSAAWQSMDTTGFSKSVRMFGEEGFGTFDGIELN